MLNSQKIAVKDTTHMHIIHLQQTSVHQSVYNHCSDQYPSAICTLDVILLNVHTTNRPTKRMSAHTMD